MYSVVAGAFMLETGVHASFNRNEENDSVFFLSPFFAIIHSNERQKVESTFAPKMFTCQRQQTTRRDAMAKSHATTMQLVCRWVRIKMNENKRRCIIQPADDGERIIYALKVFGKNGK